MRLLYITTKSPLPTNDGHSLRTYNLLRSVAAQHSVTLLSFVKFPVEYDYQSELKAICSSVELLSLPENYSKSKLLGSAAVNIFTSSPFVAHKYAAVNMRAAISRHLAQQDFDLVHLDMLPLGGYMDIIDRPVLLNAHNVESALLKRKAESFKKGPAKWYFTGQAERLKRFEKMVVSKVNHVVACSDEDRTILKSIVPSASVSVVPNGVDTNYYQPSDSQRVDNKRIVFIGGMNWFPNKDAVVWFDDEIQDELLRLDSDVRLDVIGRNDGDIKLRHHNSIMMHGFVDDVRTYLERAAVVIVPIRVGGGTRLKVLEAMSMGKAMVSTSIGVEGIRVEHDKNVLIADTPQDFAQAVNRLQNDTVLRERLGKAARELVLNQYRWDVIGQRLLDAYDSVLGA